MTTGQYKAGGAPPALVIRNALALIHEPGEVFEVRIPRGRGGTISGYFNDIDIAARLIARENTTNGIPNHAGIYATVNPVDPALLARNENKFERGAIVTTTDAEITKRRWFLIDLDPVRPSGISSSQFELDGSIDRGNSIRDWLTSLGWPAPLESVSGNGVHLMYRVDMPNDDLHRGKIEFATKMLGSIFSDDIVNVDSTVWNASRIWKIYGTISAKGSSTTERPHRMAMPISIPESMEVVSVDLIDALGKPLSESRAEDYKDMTGEFIADMVKWLSDRGQTVTSGPRPLYGNEGKKWTISRCPFDSNHTNPMVGLVNNRPVFKCLHNSCSAYKWKEFRQKIDPTFKDPDAIQARLIEWCLGDLETPDKELLESAAQTGKLLDGIMRNVKKAAPRARYLLLEEFLKAEKRRFIKETLGEGNEKGNLIGLIQRTMKWQSDGVVPSYWTSELDGRVMIGMPGTIESERYDEIHEINLLCEFHKCGDIWVKQGHCAQVVKTIAKSIRANPLKGSLKRATWDGRPRLETWLIDYMGTKDTIYTRAVGRKWLISAVARVMEPGCQADHMLILEGKQGIGKSKALRILGGIFYVEYSRTIGAATSGHKDMIAAIIGKMIIEMSELATLRKSDIETLKAILTTPVDEARLAYERDSKNYPRTCVFAGTTNEETGAYIADLSGARRFWPVKVGECNDVFTDRLRLDRDQLWAEAVEAYEGGEDWYTVPVEETNIEQSERQVTAADDTWFDVMRRATLTPDSYNNGCFQLLPRYVGGILTDDYTIRAGLASDILSIILGVPVQHQTFGLANRMKLVLRELGFRKTEPSKGGPGGSRYAYDLHSENCDGQLWLNTLAAAKRGTVEFMKGGGDQKSE